MHCVNCKRHVRLLIFELLRGHGGELSLGASWAQTLEDRLHSIQFLIDLDYKKVLKYKQ